MKLFKSIWQYLKDSIKELKKVTWPTKKQITVYTIVVIAMSLAVAIYFGILDYFFNWLLEIIIKK
ncbi:MAG: preprotein translocase subunit SecE [Candidatus Magasanikbacteria bacterium CG_4_10_14_0_8_um_filter_32_14]|uniref:Protein translocase subunit SecE n=2 Tax=Candidatus Magasanikiibacteriota TaxID=1752731 RepID=A0A2M7RBH5_9BACT|nr:MAG: preprotein translocase subunit SecE [Candidatus Magasanikbacteria bacterium CG1_02_32_51]PIY93666.1 MAG: preprotein translocase subunit SecE [Candidatus Magasanikbacteria bacterium CG_4_10_14_0_8_um_filter_32_14]